MDAESLVQRILEDEGLRGDLTDDGAEVLLQWLIAEARAIASTADSNAAASKQVDALCKRGRGIAQLATDLINGLAAKVAADRANSLSLPGKVPQGSHSDEVLVVKQLLGVR